MTPIDVRSLSIVIPVYNSEDTIVPLVRTVIQILSPSYESVEVVLVNDGSRDLSHERCLELVREFHKQVIYIRLARNFGEHNAVMCGLHQVSCDGVAIIDDDFQTPPDEINKLVKRLREGYDVVYSYYEKKQHHWSRNLGSLFNDKVATILLKKPKGLYLSSFKAMNKFLVDEVIRYHGPYPYIDGLILRATDAIGTELCEHRQREHGRSNYTLRRLVRLWLNMFTSFSLVPLRVSTYLGFSMSFFAFLLAVFFVLSWSTGGVLIKKDIPPGWASTIVVSTLFAGIQLSMLGLIGEYLGRLFLTENKHPQFVVREMHGKDEDDHGTDT